jgi:ABC-type transport system involved in Fe-S cluster assembly fused permease/ATPase subunit
MTPPAGLPAPDQPPADDARFGTLVRFLPYLWPAGRPDLRRRVALAFLLVLLAKATLLVLPFAYKALIDRMAAVPGTSDSLPLLVALVAAYAAARFANVLFDNLRNAVFERVGQEATRNLATDVIAHLHALSLSFHLERKTGQLTRIIERGTKSIDLMLYLLLFSLAPVLVELAAVLVIFGARLGMELVAATLAMVAVYAAFTWKVTAWRSELRRRMVELDNRASATAVDALLNYETVKYFNAERTEQARYGAAAGAYAEAAIRSENSLALLNIGQSLITNLMMGAGMAFTVWGWAEGRFTPGDVVLVNTLLMQLFRPLDILGLVYREVRQGLIDMEAMFRLLDTEPEIRDADHARPLEVRAGTVAFEDVRFGYDPRREILKGVSFTVPAGTRTAIVGPSGAGKSTIARLLFRFFDVDSGAIRIDGQDIRDVTQRSLRAALGIVPQDTVLFNDTIAANIAYGREGASVSEVEAAARAARIHDFAAQLPDGYATLVGERGLKLSGGEKQRVAIARTILKDPPILILDEATSALDSATEAGIQEALERLGEGRTEIVIAHRLSTIVEADQILVMDDGRIVERGRHAELLARGGVYAALWALQQAEEEAAGP